MPGVGAGVGVGLRVRVGSATAGTGGAPAGAERGIEHQRGGHPPAHRPARRTTALQKWRLRPSKAGQVVEYTGSFETGVTPSPGGGGGSESLLVWAAGPPHPEGCTMGQPFWVDLRVDFWVSRWVVDLPGWADGV